MTISSTKEDFIEKARKVHGDKYDYSKSVYNGPYEKLCVICPEHGEFWVSPNAHTTVTYPFYNGLPLYMPRCWRKTI